MQQQKVNFNIKGMSQDLAASKFNPEFAFENKNIRFTPTDDNTLLVMTNEKGTSEITPTGDAITNREILGYAVIENTIVLFEKSTYNGSTYDIIDTLVKNNSSWVQTILYYGDLNFNNAYPIETLPLYESATIQKVYWVDGRNQPRMINIKNVKASSNNNNQFDFLPSFSGGHIITYINHNTTGSFPAGSIQYAFNYSNKNGQETKIIDASSLLYTSKSEIAGSPEELVDCSFLIRIWEVDKSFDYINIYSIIRTSYNGQVITNLVTRIKTSDIPVSDTSVAYTDSNYRVEAVDPTELLYKGGSKFIAETITSKDNTLFLGNLNFEGTKLNSAQRSYLEECASTPTGATFTLSNWELTSGYYPKRNILNDEVITYLRHGNYYRLGIQFQDNYGNWLEPICLRFGQPKTERYWRNDLNRPLINNSGGLVITYPQFTIQLTPTFTSLFKKVRPVIVYPEDNERAIIAQGTVCPTVFSGKHRKDKTVFAQSSWFFRPYTWGGYNEDLGQYSVEARSYHSLPGCGSYNAEIATHPTVNITTGATDYCVTSGQETYLDDQYFIDGSILTFHSPDITNDFNKSLLSSSNKLKIVGGFIVDSLCGKSLLTITPDSTTSPFGAIVPESSLGEVYRAINGIGSIRNLFTTQTLWSEVYDATTEILTGYFAVYPWTRKTLSSFTIQNRTYTSKINYKVLSNIRNSQYFFYYNDVDSSEYNLFDAKIYRKENYTIPVSLDSDSVFNDDHVYYYGSIDSIYTHNDSYTEDYYKRATSINGNLVNDTYSNSEGIQIRYKSTDHLVLGLVNKELPIPYVGTFIPPITSWTGMKRPWSLDSVGDYDSTIKVVPNKVIERSTTGEQFMWLTELTRTVNPATLFGGNNEFASSQNMWIPCGPSRPITGNTTTVYIKEGDTVFNRWDCVKTLPYSTEDTNQIVEIMSFMCESYINTGGRYDKYAGLKDYTFLNEGTGFNLFNPAYNNKNNFFNYRITDYDNTLNTNYSNLITWSTTKTLEEDVDSWTNINLTSTLSLDGNLGEIRALRQHNNSIICFQDKGLSEILYNPTTAIATGAGVPLEIANSGKVEGKRYISTNIGCINKWSICSTPRGLYFIDSITKKVYRWSGDGLDCISDEKGMSTWFNKRVSVKSNRYSPIGCNDIVSLYDRTTEDVYFTNDDYCLAYNEKLGNFTSLYDYNNTSFLVNLNNDCLNIRYTVGPLSSSKIYLMHGGDYNNFFGTLKDYYTKLIVNPNPTQDKIFTNVDFIADTYIKSGNSYIYATGSTFNKLNVDNEYQSGESILVNDTDTLRKKFRVWHANIPRNNLKLTNTRDRIRNPWIYLKLSRVQPNPADDTAKTILHNIGVTYYI